MQMSEVKKRAGELGLKPGKMGKADLIHAIQDKERNVSCFQTGLESCDQFNCCWRDDCLPRSTTGKKEDSKHEAFLKKIKVELKEFSDKIERLKGRANTMVGRRKTEALEDIKQLEKKFEEEVKLKIHKLAGESKEIWQSTRKSLDVSWKDIKKSFQDTSSKLGRTKRKDQNSSLSENLNNVKKQKEKS